MVLTKSLNLASNMAEVQTEEKKRELEIQRIENLSNRFVKTQEIKDIKNLAAKSGTAEPVIENEDNEAGPVFNAELTDVKPPVETDQQKAEREKREKETPPTKINFTKFKPFIADEDIDEDKIVSAWETDRKAKTELETQLKAKDQQLAIIKEGKNRLATNKQYQYFDWVAGLQNEEAVKHGLAVQYMNDGLDEKQATTKANARFDTDYKGKEGAIEDYAIGVRKWGKENRATIEQGVQKELEDSGKDIVFITPSADFEKKVQENFGQMEDFVGMVLPKDKREKLQRDAYIAPAKINELLKNPATYNLSLIHI